MVVVVVVVVVVVGVGGQGQVEMMGGEGGPLTQAYKII